MAEITDNGVVSNKAITTPERQGLLSRFFKKKTDTFVNQIHDNEYLRSHIDQASLQNILSKKKNVYLSHEYLPKYYYRVINSGDDLVSKTNDFGSMYRDPILSMALEYVVDDTTQYSPLTKKRIWGVSDNKSIADAINDMFGKIDLQERLWYITSRTALYGNCFIRIYYMNEDYTGGISHIEIEEDILRYIPIELDGFMLKYIDKYTNEMLEPFEVYPIRVNMLNDQRLIGDYFDVNVMYRGQKKGVKNTFVYGSSFFENVRRIWKQRILTEDSIMMMRLDKGFKTRIYKLATAGLTAENAEKLVDFYSELLNYDFKVLSRTENIIKGNEAGLGQGASILMPVANAGDLTIEEFGGDVDVQGIKDMSRLDDIFYAGLRIPRDFLGLCLNFKTKIKLLNGTDVEIGTMYENKQDYIGKNVYTCDKDGNISVAPIKDIYMNRPNASFVRVHLDNNEYVDATPDHPFMLRNGEYKKAEDLIEGESLMPIYITEYRGYPEIKQNSLKGGFKFIHRWIGEILNNGIKIEKDQVVHHKDENKLNNEFDNLQVMSKEEHSQHHKYYVEKWMKAGWKQRAIKSSKNKEKKCKHCGTTEDLHMEKKTGKIYNSCNTCYSKALSEGISGVKKCDEMRKKLSESTKGKPKYWIRGDKNPMANPENRKKYDLAYKAGLEKRDSNYFHAIKNCASCGKQLKEKAFRLEKKYNEYLNSNSFCDYKCSLDRYRVEDNKNKLYYNHKVIRVEKLDIIENAYDIEIDSPNHNFGLTSGVFVHNSNPEGGSGGINIGESALIRKEIRYARSVKKQQFAQIRAWKTIAYYHLLSLGYNVNFEESFDIVMTTVSTAEDEEFKNAFNTGIESFNNFMSLIGSVKDVLQDTSLNKEKVIDILKFLTTKVLAISDFDWNDFFQSYSEGEEKPKDEVEENPFQPMKNSNEEPKAIHPNEKPNNVAETGNNNPTPEPAKENPFATESKLREGKIIYEYHKIKQEKKDNLNNILSNFISKRKYFVPKMEATQSIKYVAECFGNVRKNGKGSTYMVESQKRKLKLEKDMKTIFESNVRYFDINLFEIKTYDKDFDTSNYEIENTKIVDKININNVMFAEGMYDLSDIIQSNDNSNIIIYEVDNTLMINYVNGCSLMKYIYTNENKIPKCTVIKLKNKKK